MRTDSYRFGDKKSGSGKTDIFRNSGPKKRNFFLLLNIKKSENHCATIHLLHYQRVGKKVFFLQEYSWTSMVTQHQTYSFQPEKTAEVNNW